MIMFKNISKDIMVASSESGSGLSNSVSESNRIDMEDPKFSNTRTAILKDEQNEATREELMVTYNNALGFSNKTFGLNEFLTRPTYLATLPWSSTQPVGTVLTNLSPLAGILSNNVMKDKLSNMRYITTDIEVTVKVNPQPFEMGMLMVVAIPGFTNLNLSLAKASVLPHMLINVTANNNVTMRLPFVNGAESYDLTSVFSNQTWSISVLVVSPLQTTVLPSTLNVELWASFVDPKISVPIAQSGDSDLKDTNKEGIVTKITGVVADTLEMSGTTLAKLPFVGAFVPPLTWLSRAANKVSSYYGWSKPINVRSVNFVTPGGAFRACNGEGQDNSVALAISPDNGVDSTKSMFTDVDEMDFGYLLERKLLVATTEFKVDDNTEFYEIDTGLAVTGIPQHLIIENFLWARYVTKFEIHVVKTRFHVGRLLLQWNYTSLSNRDNAVDNMNAVYSKIVDLSTSNVFTFTVPWMDSTPYRKSKQDGYMSICVFNEIEAPDTVAQNIDLVIYKSFTDFEGGFPYRVAQSGCCTNFEPIVSDDLIPYEPCSFAAACQGEMVTSLRLLAKRFTLCGFIQATGSNYTIDGSNGQSVIEKSLFGAINGYYAYRSGGIRFKFIFPKKLNVKVTLGSVELEGPWNPAQWFFGHLSNVAEVTIPFYSQWRRNPVLYPWSTLKISFFDDAMQLLPPEADTSFALYVAANDDYNASVPVPLRTTNMEKNEHS